MKTFILALVTSTILYSAPPEVVDNLGENIAPQMEQMIEIGTLEISSLTQQPIIPTDLEMPTSILNRPPKKLWVAVSFASLFPGLGHVYLDDMETAGALMGTAGGCYGFSYAGRSNESVQQLSLITLQATSGYNLYAAYRDARLYNGDSRYSYKMPTDGIAALTAAPLKWSVIKKPEVWGGVLGAFSIAVATAYFAYPQDGKMAANEKIVIPTPIAALPVAVGEESLFRGFLQSAISEALNPTAGIILSSLAFGAAHIPNALKMEHKSQRRRYYTVSLPLITSIGGYLGWLTHKNHSLQESVAVHAWYDFILFSINAVANQAASTGKPGFAFAAPF